MDSTHSYQNSLHTSQATAWPCLSSIGAGVGGGTEDGTICVSQCIPGVVVCCAPNHHAMQRAGSRLMVQGTKRLMAALHLAVQAELQVREIPFQGVHPLPPATLVTFFLVVTTSDATQLLQPQMPRSCYDLRCHAAASTKLTCCQE